MSEMNSVSRFFINLGNTRRSARLLRALDSARVVPLAGRILELGAGKGGLSALLQAKYRPSHLAITDFDPRQVDVARAFFSNRLGTVPTSVEFRAVDAKSLPFDDHSFDLVFAMLMLHHVEEHHHEYQQRPIALREIRRVLAPGGYLVYSDFSRTEDVRRTLGELGFTSVYRRQRWPHLELAAFRSPGAPPP
ncbi:MAG: class I SAM-dependent methyltransferase [Thermoplasmata archaeon]